MKDWHEIKEEIYHQEEPLSEADLRLMRKKLHAPKFLTWGRVILLLLLASSAIFYWQFHLAIFSTTENAKPSDTEASSTKPKIERPTPMPSLPFSVEDGLAPKNKASAPNLTKNRPSPESQVSTDQKATAQTKNSKSNETPLLAQRPKMHRAPIIDSLMLRPWQAFEQRSSSPSSVEPQRQTAALSPAQDSARHSALGDIETNNKSLTLKIFGGYGFALNEPQAQQNSQQQHFRFAELNQQEGLGGGFNFGLEGHYQLLPFLRLGLGLEFFELQKYYAFNHQIDDIPVIDSSSGNILGYLDRNESLTVAESGLSSMGFLGVPFSLHYRLPLSERWSLGGEARYTHYFNLYASGRQLNPQSLTLEELSRSSAQEFGSLKLSLQLQYQLGPHWSLGLEGHYLRFLDAPYQNASYRWQPQFVGMQLQVIFQF